MNIVLLGARLLQPELSAALSGQQDQDRPLLHRRPRRGPGVGRSGRRYHQAGEGAQPRGGRRGGRNAGPEVPPGRRRLPGRAGIPVFAAHGSLGHGTPSGW